jgi:hypothetical protein
MLFPAGSVSGATMSSEITVSAQNFPEYEPDVAYNSTRDEYFVVWYDDDGTAFSVMGARYTAAGVFIGEYVIAYESNPARDNVLPSVVYDPANEQYFVVWVRDYWGDGSDHDIYGRYVPWDGPDGGHLAFSINGAVGNQIDPRVAYGGTAQEFMVTWWNAGAAPWVSAQRFAAGGPAQGGVITVTSDVTQPRMYPDIAYNQARNEYIIAYQRENMGNTDIYGVRLSASGAILGGGDFGIAAWPDPESLPRIAASRVSNIWAVVWQSDIPATNLDVFARLIWVDGTGAVQMAAPIQVASTSANESYPDIAAHPESSNFLIAWEQQYSSTSGPYGIHSRVLNAASGLGKLFGPTAPSGLDQNDRKVPAVAGGVNDWMVVWEHERFATPSYQDIHGRILFADILTDGFESGDTTGWSSTVP